VDPYLEESQPFRDKSYKNLHTGSKRKKEETGIFARKPANQCVGSGFSQVSGSGSGIRIRTRKAKIKKFQLLDVFF
jgi:hypothetical protein